jgi:hypothetical protein
MNMPNVWVDEQYGTKIEKTRKEQKRTVRKFCAFAKSSFDAYMKIRSFICSRYPVITERIESLTVTENDETDRLWEGECTFITLNLNQMLEERGLPDYSFSTKGGTANVTQSLRTAEKYAGWRPMYQYTEAGDGQKKFEVKKDAAGKIMVVREDIPNFHGGINWNEESNSFDGTEIVVPSWKSMVKMTVPNSVVDANYLRMLRIMTGTVNSNSFDGMHKGECLFVGCDGTRRLRETPQDLEEESEPQQEIVWDLSFDFLGAPNRRTWINNIGYVKKRGWEFMHMIRRPVALPINVTDAEIPGEEEDKDEDYENEGEPSTKITNNEGKTILTPVAVFIEEVYRYADFKLFGFNYSL